MQNYKKLVTEKKIEISKITDSSEKNSLNLVKKSKNKKTMKKLTTIFRLIKGVRSITECVCEAIRNGKQKLVFSMCSCLEKTVKLMLLIK